MQEIKHALRRLAKSPGYTAVAVLTLALGIGANTAIFSVVHTVLLRPTPYPSERPEDVYMMREQRPGGGEMSVSYPTFKDWQQEAKSFDDLAGFFESSGNLGTDADPVHVQTSYVTYNYFSVMGVQPLVGRFLTSEEDRLGAEGVAVLNYLVWRNRFGSDPNIVGRTVRYDGKPLTIVGVLPGEFDLVPVERIFVSLERWFNWSAARSRGNHHGIWAIARAQESVTRAQVEAEMTALAKRFEEAYPLSNSGVGSVVKSYREYLVEDFESTMWMLLGAVGLVLLIACSNVANLQLARAVGRRKESAICAALGAGRWRRLRQGLTESALLAGLGAALGLAIAFATLGGLQDIAPDGIPRVAQAELDWQVLLFTLASSVATAVIFGLGPALKASEANLVELLKEGGRSSGVGLSGRRIGRWFLVGEIALTTVLLIGAGLLIQTIYNLTRVDPGFRNGNILTMSLMLTGEGPAGEVLSGAGTSRNRMAVVAQIKEKIDALPGVEHSAIGHSFPMMGTDWTSIFIVDDQPIPERSELPSSAVNPVGFGFFESFGIELLEGRLLLETDDWESRRVAVVNDKLARRFWPDGSAIGKRLKHGWPETEGPFDPWREIVGVVRSSQQSGLDEEPMMEAFIPLAQNTGNWLKLVVRTTPAPRSLIGPVKTAIAEVVPAIPLYNVRTMDQLIAEWMTPRTATAALLGTFAALALILAAVGLYGVIAYSVAQRTQEMGVRIAVGASPADIFKLVVGQGLSLAILGTGIGAVAAIFLAQTAEGLLFGVTSREPTVYLAVVGVLAGVAVAACYLPARRATRVDPIEALHYE